MHSEEKTPPRIRIMTDTLILGSCPTAERQSGEHAHCFRFKAMIEEVCGPEPAGARLDVRSLPYDETDYPAFRGYTVKLDYDANDNDACAYAAKVKANLPTHWNLR